MERVLRMTGRRLRILNLRLQRLPLEPTGANAATTRPSPSGVFAALLVEWKQTQARDLSEEVAETKSA